MGFNRMVRVHKINLSDLKEKEKAATTKPITSSSTCTSSTKVGNPFSKVGNVVVSDSDDDEVLEYPNETNYFGSGGNERSLLEHWKDGTGDYNDYEDDYFDDCGLSAAQLKAIAIHDIRLG